MKIFALILAGGQGSRMGGVDKGLVQWHNKALIDHVIEKIRPQVSHIAISANRNLESYAQRSAHVFSDARQWQHYGPLAALCTAANDFTNCHCQLAVNRILRYAAFAGKLGFPI